MKLRTLLCLSILLAVLVSCGGQQTPQREDGKQEAMTGSTATHKHSFGPWTVICESTCQEKGVRERACSCGEIERVELSIGAHIPTPMPALSPTCTEEGHTEGLCCAVCGDVLDNQSILPPTGHILETTPAVAPTCSAQGRTVGAHCILCGEVLAVSDPIPTTAHQPTDTPSVKPTCTEDGLSGGTHCAICQTVLTAPTKVAAAGHIPVASPTVEPTCTSLGHRGGTQCATCGAPLTANTVINMLAHTMKGHRCTECGYCDIDFTDPSLYESDYGYEFLGTQRNGQAMQAFYRGLDEVARNFHVDTAANATDWVSAQKKNARLSAVSYAEHGLSYEEAMLTFRTFHNDRPLYYWMTAGYSHDSEKGTWALQVSGRYADGADREEENRRIYAAIDRYSMSVEELDSAYEIALTLHDAIVAAVDYTYEADGKTPSGELWAHSIVGVLLEKGAVCESYAVTFQLLLNLCDVENVYVEGFSGGRHAWNMVRMDDGKWYWFDLTWNDIGEEFDGVRYQFFCVGDTQFINWNDARQHRIDILPGSQTFPQTHIPYEMSNENLSDRQYGLPGCATSVFDHTDVLELGETFTVDGLTYARWDADEVSLVAADDSLQGVLVIPDTVTWDGRTYTVSQMCAVDAQGRFHSEQPILSNGKLTEITLPQGLKRLRYHALKGNTSLQRVTVSRDVTYFANAVFDGCESLREICFEGTKDEWNRIAKDRNWDRGLSTYTVRCTDGEITK